jgi:hypothetical protein
VTALVRAQRETAPLPKGTNVLFGRVLDMGSDQPIAGAVVTLVGLFDATGKPPERWPQSIGLAPTSTPIFAMTTADGYFVFRNLPAGRYSIAADALGYVNENYPLHLVEVQDRTTPTDAPLRLWKTGAISGTVIDDRGEPVVGATVMAFRSENRSGGVALRTGMTDVDTDDRGQYRIPVPPGRYVVAVLSSSLSMPATLATAVDASASNRDESREITLALLKGGGAGSLINSGEGQRTGDVVLRRSGPQPVLSSDGKWLTYTTTLYPGTASPADATVVTIGSGETRTGIDVPIRFAPTVEVSGVVIGPDGPMNGLTLELRPPGGATSQVFRTEQQGGLMRSYAELLGVGRAISDGSGRFRFVAVSPGSYNLQAAFIEQPEPTPGNAGVSLSVSQPLTVGDRSITGLTIAMQEGAHVAGRAQFNGAAEPPLSQGQRLAIGLRPIGADLWRSVPGVARPDGTFRTGGDAPGRYIVYANDPPGWTLESVSRGGKPLPDDVIDLGTADVADIVLTFSRTPTRVSGSISSANRTANDSADVIVLPADTMLWREGIINSRRARLMHATSAATFEFSGLEPGDYYLAAVATRSVPDWQDPSFLERLIPGATRLTLGSGEEKTVPLTTMTLRDR